MEVACPWAFRKCVWVKRWFKAGLGTAWVGRGGGACRLWGGEACRHSSRDADHLFRHRLFPSRVALWLAANEAGLHATDVPGGVLCGSTCLRMWGGVGALCAWGYPWCLCSAPVALENPGWGQCQSMMDGG
jgi:hypothetical protein